MAGFVRKSRRSVGEQNGNAMLLNSDSEDRNIVFGCEWPRNSSSSVTRERSACSSEIKPIRLNSFQQLRRAEDVAICVHGVGQAIGVDEQAVARLQRDRLLAEVVAVRGHSNRKTGDIEHRG